jgi:hypothetical protein
MLGSKMVEIRVITHEVGPCVAAGGEGRESWRMQGRRCQYALFLLLATGSQRAASVETGARRAFFLFCEGWGLFCLA